jgi:AcrR family transcriptional regulator
MERKRMKLARPAKKPPEQWKNEILDAAKELFLSKGYEETAITDIMELVGGAKGMFYRFFQSKEEVMHALGDRMFFENNPFEAVRERSELNGLEKIREVLALDRAKEEREEINTQAISILKDPRILATAIEANRRVLTPLWLELIEEGRRDGSIQTDYAKELSELLPLINFWLMPSLFPADESEIRHKCQFIAEVLSAMGLPIIEDEMYGRAEKILGNSKEGKE